MTQLELEEAIETYLSEMKPFIIMAECKILVLHMKQNKEQPDLALLEAHAFVAAIYNTSYFELKKVYALLPKAKWDNYWDMLGDDAEDLAEVILYRAAMKQFITALKRKSTHFKKVKHGKVATSENA